VSQKDSFLAELVNRLDHTVVRIDGIIHYKYKIQEGWIILPKEFLKK